MKTGIGWILAIATLFTHTLPASAIERYVSPAGGHLAPFTDWAGAATNIQDAIDVAEAGDLIWVTNGIYATGGRVADGLLTNRVVVNKAVTVKSVNGPEQTIIEGRWDPVSTNGAAAVRGVWLGADATLDGFQVRKGATLLRVTADGCGGGVYCGAPSALVANCILSGNAAESQGGASFYGTLSNCVVSGNSADYGGGCASNTIVRCKLAGNVASISGGGSYFCRLTSCLLIGNWASSSGGSSKDLLRNCTVTGNSASASVGGVGGGSLTNCIVWGNKAKSTPDIGTCTLSYCCVSPLQPGVGNIAVDPQLLADNLHLSMTSPCRGAGTANSPGTTDFDGQTWADSPAIGCDEWHPEPVISIPPSWRLASDSRPGIRLLATVAGAGPFQCHWTWNGLPIQNDAHYSGAESTILLVRGLMPADAGNYQVVVSNASGVATSPPAPFVIRCADAAGAAPAPPYTTWATAASSIQDAIDAAQPGDLVLVTNGVYAVGGKATVLGPLTNRVALDKAVVVASVNGAEVTTIQGQWDPVGTNGPAAIRCAWVTNGAVLDGFTLTGGATRAASSGQWDAFGGGVWCSSPDAVVANCVIAGNTAFRGGGGSWNGTLVNCTIKYNTVINSTGGQGGGAMLGFSATVS